MLYLQVSEGLYVLSELATATHWEEKLSPVEVKANEFCLHPGTSQI